MKKISVTNSLFFQLIPPTISLTSKLLWRLVYHQVKLFSSCNMNTGATDENLIIFGSSHDYNYGEAMIDTLPAKAVA